MVWDRTHTVALQNFMVHCDRCRCTHPSDALPPKAHIVRVPSSSVYSPHEALYHADGTHDSEEEARQAAVDVGWKAVNVFGKIMDFCPNCQKKEATP